MCLCTYCAVQVISNGSTDPIAEAIHSMSESFMAMFHSKHVVVDSLNSRMEGQTGQATGPSPKPSQPSSNRSWADQDNGGTHSLAQADPELEEPDGCLGVKCTPEECLFKDSPDYHSKKVEATIQDATVRHHQVPEAG